MRAVIAVLFVTLLVPHTAQAQTDDGVSKKLIKVLVGGSAVVIGTAVAAKSSQTTTVTTPLGQTETSSFSKSQLVTGLSVAGVGGLVLWSGLKHHDASPTISVGLSTDQHHTSFLIRRMW